MLSQKSFRIASLAPTPSLPSSSSGKRPSPVRALIVLPICLRCVFLSYGEHVLVPLYPAFIIDCVQNSQDSNAAHLPSLARARSLHLPLLFLPVAPLFYFNTWMPFSCIFLPPKPGRGGWIVCRADEAVRSGGGWVREGGGCCTECRLHRNPSPARPALMTCHSMITALRACRMYVDGRPRWCGSAATIRR